jgi:hypothetical protein
MKGGREGGRGGQLTLVSSMTAQRMPVRSMAARRLSSVSWWYSWEPWEKLKRATLMPARSRRETVSTEREAGPSVHTILVLGRRRVVAAVSPSSAAIAARSSRGTGGRKGKRVSVETGIEMPLATAALRSSLPFGEGIVCSCATRMGASCVM